MEAVWPGSCTGTWGDLPEPRPSHFQVRYKPSAWTGRPTPQPLLQSILPGAGLCGGAGPWAGCGARQRDKAPSLWCPGLCTCGCCPAVTELLLHPPIPTPLLTRKDLGLGMPLAVNPFSTGRGWPPGQTPSPSLHWVPLVSTFLSP